MPDPEASLGALTDLWGAVWRDRVWMRSEQKLIMRWRSWRVKISTTTVLVVSATVSLYLAIDLGISVSFPFKRRTWSASL